jgi:hypothetical protein
LLGLAALAVAVALLPGRSRDAGSAESAPRFVCPMHPDVTSAVPGACPICGMDLERVAASADRSSATIDPSTYLNYDIMRKRGTGPDTPAPAWVEDDGSVSAILYDDELSGLSADSTASFFAAGARGPQTPLHPNLAAIQRWDRSTSRVGFRVDAAAVHAGAGEPPRPGQVGRVRLTARGSELPLIEYSALLEGSDGPYVMVASADGRTLSKRSVEVGKAFGGMVFVLSGLGPRERVLTRSAFFVDAERRLRRETVVEVKR